MQIAVFLRGLEPREEQHRARSVSALAKQVRDASYDNDHDCCFVHYVRKCAECHGYNRPRPDEPAWGRLLAANPLTVPEEGLIARYRKAVDNARRGGRLRHVEDLPPLQGLPRTPPRSLARLPTGPRVAPNYPTFDPANAQDIGRAWGRGNRGRERRDAEEQRVEQHDDRRASRSPPRYAERYPRYPQEARGRHAETVQRDRRQDAEEEQRRRRAAARQQQHHEPDRQQHGSWRRGQAEEQQQRWDQLLRLECKMVALRGELIGAAHDPPKHRGRRDRADGWNQRRWG